MTKVYSVKTFLDRCAISIIKQMPNNFDSHDFIFKLMELEEEEYINTLNTFISDGKNIFKEYHRQIGLYLSAHQSKLNITKDDNLAMSMNVKGYISECAAWQKQISL